MHLVMKVVVLVAVLIMLAAVFVVLPAFETAAADFVLSDRR